MPAIRTEGLTKRFGAGRFGGSEGVVAVENLDLEIDEGEIFGFLGPNGAGKSTTINLLLDFIRPTAGSAEVLGMDAQAQAHRIRERIGVLPEGYGYDESLTGREYVEWAVETKGAADDPDEIIATVGLRGDEHRLVDDYSKGMQQRLAFGMALVDDPDLLILDEPSSGLDPTGIQQIRQVVRERAADGTTVFFSSHILSEVEAVCDRVGVMNEGRLVAVDSIDGLREEVGGHASIELECATVPADLRVGSLDGVVGVDREDTTLTVHCEHPSDKADIVTYVADRTDVQDVISTGASLEELFNAYTGGGREGVDGDAGPASGADAGTGRAADGAEVES